MTTQFLFSSPEEKYSWHIKLCREKFKVIYPSFLPTIKRILNNNDEQMIEDAFLKMINYHDLGKLTKKWQENLLHNKRLPSHSPIGAAYLWKILPEDIKKPLSFAVAIHHTDKGLLSDNIEKPDVQAILDGIVDYSGKIVWDEKAYKLEDNLFPDEGRNLNVNDLKEMARGLRIWAKGGGILEQHQRRLQASLAHHILKLCDISAATERKEYQKENEQDYYGGWLMVEDIKNYVDTISKRIKL